MNVGICTGDKHKVAAVMLEQQAWLKKLDIAENTGNKYLLKKAAHHVRRTDKILSSILANN